MHSAHTSPIRSFLAKAARHVGALAFLGTISHAQVLYTESFDSEESAKVAALTDEFCFVDYVDYSGFTIGNSDVIEIPEAPGMIEGSEATRGVVLRVNVESDDNFGTVGAANLVLADENEGSGIDFSGNYRLTFDLWINLYEFADRSSSGTTELGMWGIGTDGEIIGLDVVAPTGTPSGTYGVLAGEGGNGSADAMVYVGADEIERKNDGSGNEGQGNYDIFAEAFPDGNPIVPAPNNSWVQVEVISENGTVTVNYNGVEFHKFESSDTEGKAFVGYADQWTSLSFEPDYSFALIDNVQVEQIGANSYTIAIDSPVGTAVTTEGTVAMWTISNVSEEALTVSEANITGDDAAAFTVLTELPLLIGAEESAQIQVAFRPEEPNGDKNALLTLVTTDANEPEREIELNGRREVPEPLMAHFKMDDPEGTTVLEDSSGLNTLGTVFANPDDPLEYSQASLLGDGDTGTSIGFTAASAAGVGNFGQLDPIHTPTISVSMWIQPTDIAGDQTLFNRDPLFNAADAIYGCILADDGSILFNAAGGFVAQTDPELIVAGEPNHVVITHLDEDGFGNDTATRTAIYINGVLAAEAEGAETTGFDVYPAASRTTTMFIASRTAAGSGYTGLIDDIQVYSIELSEEQVAAMFAAPGITAFDEPPAPFVFEFTSIVPAADSNNVTLTWTSKPNKTYLLQGGETLTDWDEVSDGIESGGDLTTFTDMDVPEGAKIRYYRVLEE